MHENPKKVLEKIVEQRLERARREGQSTVANENGLIYRAQAGDEEAFAELMRTYYAYVYTIVIGIVGNPNDAEEIVQDTFLSAYRGLGALEDTAKFKSWLAEIARNHARDRLRKQRVETVSIDDVGEHTLRTPGAVDDELIRDEQRELIRRAMETLSEKDREIAHSYYLEGASYDELMQTHGLSYKAISFRLSRAKQRLAKRLQYLLTGLSVPPATILKQLYSGGLTVMKAGTVPKLIIGAIGIIALIFIGFIGSRTLLSSKDKHSQSVEAVGHTSDTTAQSVTQTDATRGGDPTKPSSEAQRPITEQERHQIKNFFSQFEESDAQSEADTPQSTTASESEIESASTDTGAALSTTEQSAEDVMHAYLEAFRNLDFEAMLPLTTGDAKAEMESTKADMEQLPLEMAGESPEMQSMMESVFDQMFGGAEIVSSEYVGDEFHFRLRMPTSDLLNTMLGPLRQEMANRPEIADLPPMPQMSDIEAVVKMRKEDGAWQIYDTD